MLPHTFIVYKIQTSILYYFFYFDIVYIKYLESPQSLPLAVFYLSLFSRLSALHPLFKIFHEQSLAAKTFWFFFMWATAGARLDTQL